MVVMKEKINVQYILFILVVFYILFILFSHLDSLPIKKWDEARNAMNAIEMLQKEFSLITTSHYKPDHWNTKPPLLIWIQYFSFKVFGINELSTRLISVTSAFFVFIFLAFNRKTLNYKISKIIIFGFIHFSLPIIIMSHCYKTGDYDSLLSLFMLIYSLNYFLFLKTEKNKSIILCCLFLFFAIFTKGIAGCLFIPGLFIYTILNKKLIAVLKNPYFIGGVISCTILTISYYVIRDKIDPGYLTAIFNNELGGRFLEVNENHDEKWYYYVNFLFIKGLGILVIFLPLILFIKNYPLKTIEVFSFIILLSHITILSFSQTKLYWYILPSLPFLSILITSILFKISRNNLIFLALVCIIPCYMQIQKVSKTHNSHIEKLQSANSIYLRNYDCQYDTLFVIEKDYYEHTRFYVEKNNLENDCFIDVLNNHTFTKDDVFLISKYCLEIIPENINYSILEDFENCFVATVE
jgi:4-amino-4-deoxy-L-arabinose transferase-like glycosyltransferase